MGVDTHMPWRICRGQRMTQKPVPPFHQGFQGLIESHQGFKVSISICRASLPVPESPLLLALFPWLVTNWWITWFCSIEHGAQARALCRRATPALLAPRYLFLFLFETGLKLRAILLPQASLALQMLKLQAWSSTHTHMCHILKKARTVGSTLCPSLFILYLYVVFPVGPLCVLFIRQSRSHGQAVATSLLCLNISQGKQFLSEQSY